MDMKRHLAGYCAIFALATALGTMPANAQVTDSDSADEQPDDANNIIIVTATRRAESLQDVPVAVTALSGEVLDDAGVGSVETLAAIAPSVTFTQSSNDQNNSINIRGVGTSVFSQGVESSVSVVIDDVVMARQAMGFQDLVDVERVEVLRGPQSTLFGKNASAGVISVTTKAPSESFTAMADATIAEGGEYAVRSSVSGPLSDSFGARLTGYYKRFDGHIDNADGRDLNGYENWGVRGKLRFEPDPGFVYTLIADYRETQQDCCIYTVRDTTGATGATAGGRLDALLLPVVAGPENTEANVNAPVFNNTDQFGLSGKAEIELGDGYSLVSISAFRDYNFENNIDVDDLPLAEPQPGIITFDRNGGTTEITQMSQEIRLVSPEGPPFDFILGGYAFFLDIDRLFERRFEIAVPTAGGILRLNQSTRFQSSVSTENLALFGSANVYLTDDLTIFGGLRYIDETLSYSIDRDPTNVLVPGDRPFGGLAGTRTNVVDETSDTALTGDIGIRYEITPDILAYARYARGYKGKGIDAEIGAPANPQPIEAETSDAYELGLKSSFAGGDVIVNLAAFRTNFENFQEQGTVLLTDAASVLTAETQLTNVGSVRTEGIEFEVLLRPTDSLFVQGGVSYTDATIRSFPNAGCYFGQTAAEGCVPVTLDDRGTPSTADDIVRNLQDLSGGELPNSPDWRVTGIVRQDFDLGDRLDAFAQVSGRWQSSINYSLNGDPRATQDGYAIVNLTIGAELDDGSVGASVFVNNVFDTFYATSIFGDPLFAGVVSHYVPRDFGRYFGGRLFFRY